MIRNLHLLALTLLSAFVLNGQNQSNTSSGCGSGAPPAAWDQWFNAAVEKYVENLQSGKTQLVTHEIPVIFHIVHFGEAVGTFPNIDSNQVKSQIAVLNNDFAGTGLNVGNLPLTFSGLVANTGIRFCLATKNPQGGALNEKGIQRIDASGQPWGNPNTPTVSIKAYIEGYIKPSSMWDPIRYLNVWLSDKSPNEPLRGYATYPSGTTLGGVPAAEIGTVNNDGIWIWTKAFGTLGGSLQPPWDKGRTLTHEVGHWLGLRHTWGDGNCYSDYVNDTPWAKMENTGCPASPAYIDRCGVGQSPYGEMTMNFMDGTNDACKYMFTPGQNIRMQTALSQCNYRNALGTHNLCPASTSAAVAATAGFSLNSTPCIGTPFTPFNTSNGNPPPTYIWSSTPPMVFNPAPSVANPAISITTPGSYTLSLIATNSLSSSTFTMVINSVTTCPFSSACIDTLRPIKTTDTLKTYSAPNNSLVIGCQTGFAGFLTGTNCYKDKEFAQFFAPGSYTSTPAPQINAVIVLFDSVGTKNGSGNQAIPITCKIYGGNITAGPGAQIGAKSDSLYKIINKPKTYTVSYAGVPGYVTPTKMIPFRFDFASPVIVNNNTGFFAAVDAPYFSPQDSIKIYSSQKAQTSLDSNAWFLQFSNNWKTFRYFRNSKIQLGIIPIITCSPISGLSELNNSLENYVQFMPNPSNGQFNLVLTLPQAGDLDLRIYNTLGREITRTRLLNVNNNVFNIDLSTECDGIYFAEISNGQHRLVRKLVLSH